MSRWNPWKREIAFAQAVNNTLGRVEFYIYRTVDGRVQQCRIQLMSVDLQNGALEVHYGNGSDWHCERASEQDLMLISARAKQLAAQQRKG